MAESGKIIRIPLESGFVVIYPDELPVGDLDYNDIIDILRSVLAPLKLWRSCAVEYHRQGFRIEFESVLNEIIESLSDAYVESVYRGRQDYKEGMAEIYNALAAKEVGDLARFRDLYSTSTSREYLDCSRRVVDYLNRAKDHVSNHGYTHLITGFFEIRQVLYLIDDTYIYEIGELKKAEEKFKAVYDLVEKGRQNDSSNASNKMYLFGALVGLGIVAYTKGKYGDAMGHFSKALQKHPKCLSSIRVAIASCCFKLKDYDRSRAILEKALASDPTNADILILLALLEQVAAQKDRSKRLQCRAHAYEYCLLAAAMETSIPSTLMAQNHVANHCFHTWKVMVRGGEQELEESNTGGRVVVRNAWQIELELNRIDAKEMDLRINDPIKVGSAIFTVKETTPVESSSSSDSKERFLITLAGKKELEGNVIGTSSYENPSLTVEVKEYGRVNALASDVMKKSTVPAVKAESIYIIGRLFHAQNNIAQAVDYYREAYRMCPELSLAMFGHAQIMLSKEELGTALDLFEKVLALNPDDRDTQAYVMLVKALHKRESSSLDKVKEVAPGFAHEANLWLLQGQLRQTNPAEYTSALRCYTQALECIEQQGGKFEDPRVLSNIAVLHHSLGRLNISLDFCRRSLIAQQMLIDFKDTNDRDTSNSAENITNPVFKNQHFEGVFYSWSTIEYKVQPDWNAPGWEGAGRGVASASEETKEGTATNDNTKLLCKFEICYEDEVVIQAPDLTSMILPGDELLLEQQSFSELEGARHEAPVLHIVASVTSTGFTTRSHIHQVLLTNAAKSNSLPVRLSVKRKIPGRNFCDATITMCYNYARMLEDLGHTNAAKEVYVQLLKQHPSFIDCYLRLSRIARDIGRLDEASVWVTRALTVEEMDPDAGVSLGDLYARGAKWDNAKKCYEKVIVKNHHDARTMLSLGNMYFSNLSTNPDKYIKDSYKFFHHVLTEDPKNVYAANGLGMVCAEKGQLDVARDILSRAREASMPLSEDICCNLAHIHLAQGRLMDAEHLYQAALKILPGSSSSSGGSSAKHADKIVAAYECMAFAQFRNSQHNDALYSLLKGLHNDPSCLRGWYNVAIVRADFAAKAAKKKMDRADEIEDAASHLQLARKLFNFLGKSGNTPQNQRGAQYSAVLASKKSVNCEYNVKIFSDQIEKARAGEEQRNEEKGRQEDEHKQRQQVKQLEMDRVRLAAEETKREQQRIALARQKKLEEMSEKWNLGAVVTANETAVPSTGGSKKRSKKKASVSRGDGNDENEEGGSSPLDYLDDSDDDEDQRQKKKVSLSRPSANIEDIFGGDSSDEEDVQRSGPVSMSVVAEMDGNRNNGNSPKGNSPIVEGRSNGNGLLLKRTRRDVEDDEDEDEDIFGDREQTAPDSKRRSKAIGEDDDE